MKKLSLRTVVALITLFASCTLLAHNKVVVIPLGSDDSQLEPFALIPPDDTNPADYISANGVTLDTITGLEWEQVGSGSTYSLNNALGYCITLELNNKNDWRLPTFKELLSIVDFGTFSPSIDGSAFPATGLVDYWTTTRSTSRNDIGFYINFIAGVAFLSGAESLQRVRCVRSNAKNALVQVFNENGDGSVTDLASGLIWQQQDDNNTYTHIQAISYCQNLIMSGSDNWRLPSVKELASLLDHRASAPTIDSQLFPILNEVFDYWSASTLASDSSRSWGVGFSRGDVYDGIGSFPTFVRCVR